MATIAISGASGLIGTALVSLLRERGDTVLRLVRKAAVQPDEVGWDPTKGEIHLDACDQVTAIVNLSGASLGRRWTQTYRAKLVESRVASTRTLARAAAELGPQVTLVNASAVGFYGDQGRTPLTEASPAGDDFLADLVAQWERATTAASEAGNRVVLARTGLVIAPAGGALGPMLPLLRAGLGGPLGPGDQIWPWISLRDEVRAFTWLIDHPIAGPVNLAAPATNTHAELVQAVAAGLGRRARLGVPGWALRLGLGGLAEAIMASQNQVPEVLLGAGFQFEQPTLVELVSWLETALAANQSRPLRAD